VASGAKELESSAAVLKDAASIGEGLRDGLGVLKVAGEVGAIGTGAVVGIAFGTVTSGVVVGLGVAAAFGFIGYEAFKYMGRSQDQSIKGAEKTAYVATFNGEGEKDMQAGKAAWQAGDVGNAAWQFTKAAGEATGITPLARLVGHVVEHPVQSAQAVGKAITWTAGHSEQIWAWSKFALAHPGQALGVAAAVTVGAVEGGTSKAMQAGIDEAKKNGAVDSLLAEGSTLGLFGNGSGKRFGSLPADDSDDVPKPERRISLSAADKLLHPSII
jgi:hypothetical protein